VTETLARTSCVWDSAHGLQILPAVGTDSAHKGSHSPTSGRPTSKIPQPKSSPHVPSRKHHNFGADAATAAAASAAASVDHGLLAIPSKKARSELFDRMDYNGNGALSLAEIDKAVVELYPTFNNKPVLMRAYKAADYNGTRHGSL
jgi:hypothetical protein